MFYFGNNNLSDRHVAVLCIPFLFLDKGCKFCSCNNNYWLGVHLTAIIIVKRSSTYFIKYCTVLKDQATVSNKLMEGLIVCKVLCLKPCTDIWQIHWVSNHFVIIRNLKKKQWSTSKLWNKTLVEIMNIWIL